MLLMFIKWYFFYQKLYSKLIHTFLKIYYLFPTVTFNCVELEQNVFIFCKKVLQTDL